ARPPKDSFEVTVDGAGRIPDLVFVRQLGVVGEGDGVHLPAGDAFDVGEGGVVVVGEADVPVDGLDLFGGAVVERFHTHKCTGWLYSCQPLIYSLFSGGNRPTKGTQSCALS